MKTWYKKLGYYENPFLINPLNENTNLIGLEDEVKDVLYYVRSGSMVFVEGAAGSGKTKFLKEIIKNFKGRIIYVNAAKLKKNLNVEELLQNKNGVKGKVFNKKPKHMILIIDNVAELSQVNLERLKFFFDNAYLQSVIFSSESIKKVGFPESMLNRIGRRIIKIKHLTKEQAVELAFSRLDEDPNESDSLITKAQVEEIFEKSGKNPKQFLLNLHRVFEEMDFEEAEKIEKAHLKVIEDKLDEEDETDYYISLGADVIDAEEQMTDSKGNKLMKIGEYYRCPVYDMFCGNCGAIVKQDDVSCPECQAEFESSVEEEPKQNKSKKSKKGEANA
ncbi:AAA family ATPase [Candidatus Woesearchaeota archaeon]|nr:AAA family ATPase [Candidatus Woesearchaeota archaeon]